MKILSAINQPDVQLIVDAVKSALQERHIAFEYVECAENTTDFNATMTVTSLDFGVEHLEHFKMLPPRVGALGCFDTLVQADGKVIPRIFAFDALLETIIKKEIYLDTRQAAYIIADSPLGLVAAAVAIHLGFQNLCLVSHDMVTLKKWVEVIERNFFLINCHAVLADGLTGQNIPCAFMINAMDLDADQALRSDISYFNFMTQNGVVLDISNFQESQTMTKDIQDAGLTVISGMEYFRSLVKLLAAEFAKAG